jgi:hypothetical protein
MNADREHGVTHRACGNPVLALVCTTCQLVYQPHPTAYSTGSTSCPRCGGWTWIAQLDPTGWPAPDTNPQHHDSADTHPSPPVPRPATQPGQLPPPLRGNRGDQQ